MAAATAERDSPMDQSGALSLWDTTSAEDETKVSLSADTQADVAIVGGGYTGLSTALHGAELGLDCLVLEAGRIGQGGSGRNAGLVNAGVWHPPGAVREALGPDYGPRFVDRFGAAPEYVFSLVERHQIRCEATRNGTIHAAHSPSGMTGLKARHAAWAELGAPVELISASAVAEMTGTRAYVGGLLDRRAGTVNPMGYARGLARAARAAGARIATGVRVRKLAREGNTWRVDTDGATVRAGHVILATNAYTDALWPGLSEVYTPISYFQIATEPLGDAARAILPGGHGLWDTAPIMTSLRRDRAGRIILGSMGEVFGDAQAGLTRAWGAARLRTLFPRLGPVRFEQAWDGTIALTKDHLPRIVQLSEGLYTPIGYNGRGITTGTIFGKAIAELLTGVDPADLPLPITGLRRDSGRALRRAAYRAAFAANQLLRAI